jgi:hypothetical protein
MAQACRFVAFAIVLMLMERRAAAMTKSVN